MRLSPAASLAAIAARPRSVLARLRLMKTVRPRRAMALISGQPATSSLATKAARNSAPSSGISIHDE